MELTKENYVDIADHVMHDICTHSKRYVSTSQIRKLLTIITDLYNDVKKQHDEKLNADTKSRIQYLKLHTVYAAGRQKTVKDFVERAELIEQIDHIGDSKERLMLFCHYMEALVAYRKYYGKRDS